MNTVRFHAEPEPSADLCAKMAGLDPENPFLNVSYLAARRALAWRPWVLSLRQRDHIISACPAFMRSGCLNCWVEIVSLPSLSCSDLFWNGLLDWCLQVKVSYLEVNSFASEEASIPSLPGEEHRKRRCEYVLDLQDPGIWERLSSNHARNIARGRKAELTVHRRMDLEACRAHVALMAASMARRRGRGEQVPDEEENLIGLFMRMTDHGAGVFYQAVLRGAVVSSIFVLHAEQGGYYHSAGTNADGMACGASHFLVHETAELLRAARMRRFNLGGVDQAGSGLEQFKRGFGARRIQLESARFKLAGSLRTMLNAGIRFIRQNVTAVRSVISAEGRNRLNGRHEPYELSRPHETTG